MERSDGVLQSSQVTRRGALAWLGGIGLAAVISGCTRESSGSSTAAGTSTTASGAGQDTAVADCVLTPELTEGPYYLDLDLLRKDITEGRSGLPLDLGVRVVDVSNSCAPIADAAVDIWHADAGGVYSGVQGDSGTFLRGIQTTDASGSAEFRTIYPGWYAGRAVHIHVKVHLASDEVHTGQVFFDEEVTELVYQREPYSQRPDQRTPNSSDSIFGESAGTTVVSVTPGTDRYRGAITLGLQPA
jgi:protocatechuate 3,4-dioxygenase beta subunit